MKNINTAVQKLRDEIRALEKRYQRIPQSVQLLAVSKKKTTIMIQNAFEAGQIHFGENYLQEALEKIQAIQDPSVRWHFIGPVQSNKTRAIAEHFDWVHTVDRIKIARRLNEQRPKQLPPLNVCIQVNISLEDSKSGVTVSELPELTREILKLPNIKLRGLMSLPQPSDDFETQRQQFQAVRICYENLRADGVPLDTLSMGTSNDLEAAIAEGATIVRIGTALFGARD